MPATATKLKAECPPCTRLQPSFGTPKAEVLQKRVRRRLTFKEEGLLRGMERYNAENRKKLTREQEVFVFKIYSRFKGNPVVRNRITDIVTKANYRIACSLARNMRKKYPIRKISLEEQIDDALRGAAIAVTKFDYKRGYKFCTYAVWWMRAEMIRAFHNEERTVRIPMFMNDAIMKVRKFSREFEKREGRKPEPAEISQGTGMSEKRVAGLLELKLNVSNAQLDMNLPDPDSDTAFSSISTNETRVILARCLEGLEERDKAVLKLRFGFGCEELTLQEVGDMFGLSRERIRQIEARALNKLRANPMIDGLSGRL